MATSVSHIPARDPTPPRAYARITSTIGLTLRNRIYQLLAMAFCTVLAILMILNTQMAGEALWFFYARSVHSGLRLYSDLHFALQPLFVLENDVWIQLFGIKTVVTEIPSVLHAVTLCIAIFLALRESRWSDWQKAIMLTNAFLLCVYVSAYRFDDFHVTVDIFVMFSLAVLLRVARAQTDRRRLQLAACLGVLSAMTITTRLNDGAALLGAVLLSLLFLAQKRKLLVASLCLLTAGLTVIVIVKLTGDSLSAYVSNSIVGAAASKGVAGSSVLLRPWLLFRNSLSLVFTGGKQVLLLVFAIFATGAIIVRYLPKTARYIQPLQLCLVAGGYAMGFRVTKQFATSFVSRLSVLSTVITCVAALIVTARYLKSNRGLGNRQWDVKEVLIFLPLSQLVAISTSTAGETESIFLYPMASLMLLVPTIQPFRKQAAWVNSSIISIMVMLILCCIPTKIRNPYSWNNFRSSPMFVNRQWYRHPVYGPMYIDRDLLNFVKPVCETINHSSSKPDLLSLPYAYPNYFCNLPPWHGYIQTYFDTSSPDTIHRLMTELNTDPPQWIVYQRQLLILSGAERGYNHGQPLPHRYLDDLIMQKIASGQWQLIDKVNYLTGDGWLIIKTHS